MVQVDRTVASKETEEDFAILGGGGGNRCHQEKVVFAAKEDIGSGYSVAYSQC